MARWVATFKTADFKEGEGKIFDRGKKSIALFRYQGSFYAINNYCPHQFGPLGEGSLVHNVVACPWHAWQFDIITGEAVHDESLKQKCYAVKEQRGRVYVQI